MGDAMGLECSRFDDNVVLKQPKLAAVCTSSQRSTWATPSDGMLDKCLIDVQTNVRVPIRRTTKRSSTMREKASHSSTASEYDDISSLRSLTSSGGDTQSGSDRRCPRDILSLVQHLDSKIETP